MIMRTQKKKYIYLFVIPLAIIILSACGSKKEPRVYNPQNYEYQDGVAWVQLKAAGWITPQYFGVVCIDENGIELFSMPEVNNDEVSNFYNGIALVKGQYIMNKDGEFIHDLKSELGIQKVVMFRNRYFDGFIFVQKITNGVAMTGILDSNLKWVIEPASKLNDTEPKGNFLYYNSSIGYYDAQENEFIDENNYKIRHIQRCFPESGLIFLTKKYNDVFTYSAGVVTGEVRLDESCQTGFYNSNLQMIIDLGYYPSVEPLSDFQGENCLLQFTTARNATYVGLINRNGEFLFIESGYVGHTSERIEFRNCYFDWEGNCYKELGEEDRN